MGLGDLLGRPRRHVDLPADVALVKDYLVRHVLEVDAAAALTAAAAR